ncbi:MAG: hypothetical protein AAGI30_04260 [Planctomycetota bacterium]
MPLDAIDTSAAASLLRVELTSNVQVVEAAEAAASEAKQTVDSVAIALGVSDATIGSLLLAESVASATGDEESATILRDISSSALGFLVEVTRLENQQKLWELLDGDRDDDEDNDGIPDWVDTRDDASWAPFAVSLAVRDALEEDAESTLRALGSLSSRAGELILI